MKLISHNMGHNKIHTYKGSMNKPYDTDVLNKEMTLIYYYTVKDVCLKGSTTLEANAEISF